MRSLEGVLKWSLTYHIPEDLVSHLHMQSYVHAPNIPEMAINVHFRLTLGLVEVESDG